MSARELESSKIVAEESDGKMLTSFIGQLLSQSVHKYFGHNFYWFEPLHR